MNVIALVVRLPDFRQTAKGPGGDASAIIVHRADCVWRSKRNGVVWRFRRNGRVWRSRGNDGRILEQAARIVLRRERRACRQRDGECEDRTFHGLRASNALEQVVNRNRGAFRGGNGRARSAPLERRGSRSRCEPFDFRAVARAALGRKWRAAISPERGVRLLNTTAAPILIGNRARVSRQEAGGSGVTFASNEKDGEKVFSSSMRVAAKNCVNSIGSEQTPRLWELGPWRALYLAFV